MIHTVLVAPTSRVSLCNQCSNTRFCKACILHPASVPSIHRYNVIKCSAVTATPPAPSASSRIDDSTNLPNWQQALAELDKKEGRKLMVAQTAPAVRVAISETLGLPPGTVTAKQMVTGLRMLGFDHVFGEQRTADHAALQTDEKKRIELN